MLCLLAQQEKFYENIGRIWLYPENKLTKICRFDFFFFFLNK